LRVEGGRAYLGRSATGLEFETEEREIVSDPVAEVSRGRSSCVSSEGPNGPRKGIKGAMSTQRNSSTDKRQKSQYTLAFPEENRGAAPTAFAGGTVRRPTGSKTWKATVGDRKGHGRWRLRRGLRARHGQKWKRHGTWEIHRRLGLERRPSMSTEWFNLRATEATVEVGLAGSTRSAGKPRTWGSSGAG
jgi:hypothetical protein